MQIAEPSCRVRAIGQLLSGKAKKMTRILLKHSCKAQDSDEMTDEEQGGKDQRVILGEWWCAN